LGILTSKEHGVIAQLDEIQAVGHRVAHGGEHFQKSEFVNDDVLAKIEKVAELAPLHNPANLKGIYAMAALLPGIRQVAVFDTAFHQSMPPKSYIYALPYSLYTKYGIRRYGFHGSSHLFVARRAADFFGLKLEESKIITCHLGNGASITAVKNGKSFDTSMGLTPTEGMIMGTRVGDVDAGALTFIMDKEEIGYAALNTLINKHSGLSGVSGVSSDMREIEHAAWNEGNERAQLALDMYAYRVIKYIGSYAAAMGGVDAIVFTGGIGENGWEVREEVCKDLAFMGVDFAPERNKKVRGVDTELTADGSRVKVAIIATNEELVIAQDTYKILS
jgi:acetate kinase